ncbi:hypothetical protein N7532_005968 [Penicillium argentinense]|uniref:HMG box domain-containing protein n=1 Tax=Penicillium argentinense TaxID=1131581 RepID=A0A9W9FF00_9EURO|nr:uncharacterized protein N7532_005968 [Penicillium argentinense]KAJ5098967.1 hypothetical protein N7532_005968 [Penicillium argentinense]
MASQWVIRAGALRQLHVGNALARPTRVMELQNQLRQLSLGSQPRSATLQLGRVSVFSSQQVCSFATASDSPKGKAGRPKGTKGKKELTEKQLAQEQKRAALQHIRDLKKTALEVPKGRSESAYILAAQQKIQELRQQGHKELAMEMMKIAASELKADPSYVDRFRTQAEENKVANRAAYDAWLKSHTPLEIRTANYARKALQREPSVRKSYPPLKDDRLPKRPLNAWLLFLMDRRASGDFKHMTVKDSTSHISGEWKQLTDAEKNVYHQRQVQDHERYRREHLEVYGEEPEYLTLTGRESEE